MNQSTQTQSSSDILSEVRGQVGFITLNRPKALNALSLQMLRDLTAVLTAWRDDASVLAVAIRGSNKTGRPGSPESLFGGFSAGGDIRFFYQAALGGDPALDAFFKSSSRLVGTPGLKNASALSEGFLEAPLCLRFHLFTVFHTDHRISRITAFHTVLFIFNPFRIEGAARTHRFSHVV